MADALNPQLIEQLSGWLKEPAWMAALRQQALTRHARLPWPHPSDDIWRRTDVALLDPARQGFAPPSSSLFSSANVSDAQLAHLTQPLGGELLAVRVNGAWLNPPSQEESASPLPSRHGFAAPSVRIEELSRAASANPEPIRRLLESDGLTLAEQKLTSLNDAFHHDDVWVDVPAGQAAARPVRLVHAIASGARHASFPLTIITVGAGSSLTLIDEYVGLEAMSAGEAALVNGRIELVLEPRATLHYVRLQRWGPRTREFLLLRSSVAEGASLTLANLNLGASLSKAHLIAKLIGSGASTRLSGFVFGQGAQHIDQHTLQDHQAPQTTSDLQFRAALKDRSRMIYTGLIRIAKEAKQTQAYQSNRNLILSSGAKAETIPMLEILADDVQCKHGASISPIDEEQAFYLMSRGVPRMAAERLIVMGFVEPVIQDVPFEPLQERLRQEIEGNLYNQS